jgi:hypothetical protein
MRVTMSILVQSVVVPARPPALERTHQFEITAPATKICFSPAMAWFGTAVSKSYDRLLLPRREWV